MCGSWSLVTKEKPDFYKTIFFIILVEDDFNVIVINWKDKYYKFGMVSWRRKKNEKKKFDIRCGV